MKNATRERSMRRSVAFGLALLAVAALALLLPQAKGQDRNFAGSIQEGYLFVQDPHFDGRKTALDGFTTEVSLKLAVDFNEHISTNVKVCYGCHGFELGMGYIDLTVSEELRFRVGRFTPSFGEFPLRHDPANHRTVDKPLPYDMGRMVRYKDFNLGILPAPYVDNGLEISGTHWFGLSLQVDYAVFVVGGLRGDNDGLDVDFTQSHGAAFAMIDNNSRPSAGGRVAATLDMGPHVSVTFGASGMYGTYDPNHKLEYEIGGLDFYTRLGTFQLRGEYLLRRTEMSLGDDPAARFKYGPGKNGKYDRFFVKDGFYLEGILPVLPRLELVARFDGLRRLGNVAVTSPLRKDSMLLRYTLGADVTLGYGVRIKLSGEYYDFSDFMDGIAATIGVVAVL